jgi:hypothetical protein
VRDSSSSSGGGRFRGVRGQHAHALLQNQPHALWTECTLLLFCWACTLQQEELRWVLHCSCSRGLTGLQLHCCTILQVASLQHCAAAAF